MRATAIVLGLLTFASLTACDGDAQTTPPDPAGRTYISTSVEGDPIPGGGPLVLGFTDPDASPSTPDAIKAAPTSTCPAGRWWQVRSQ